MNESHDEIDRRLSVYLKRSHGIQGWLDSPTDIVVVGLMKMQEFRGDVLEFGVHHGLLFILMLLGLRDGERGVAIDLFDDQIQNVSKSGGGDLEIFKANIRKCAPDKQMVILKSNTLDLKDEWCKENRGRFRFISIDGGHNKHTVLNDLKLAFATLKFGGIIALDDWYREQWSGVTAATSEYYYKVAQFFPICMSKNKLFMTNSLDYQKQYIENIKREFKSKIAEHFGNQEVFDSIIPWIT